jgi:Uma2 family endonuclease
MKPARSDAARSILMTLLPTQTPPTGRPPSNGERVPPLRNGDHLDRHEFERRYSAMPQVNKAELIEGVVYMPSPVSFENHGEQHIHLALWLGTYRAHTPGTRAGDNATVRLDLDNEPQPDALLLIDPACGGRTTITDGYVTGGPELTAEVAASSVSIDRNAKLRAYRRNGVREYLLWRVEDGTIDWFVLRGGQYEQLPVGPDGVVRSEVFPGLWLDVQALLAADLPRMLSVLQQGIDSPEHAAFVAGLQPPATQ